jgi:hypothetical protein
VSKASPTMIAVTRNTKAPLRPAPGFSIHEA